MIQIAVIVPTTFRPVLLAMVLDTLRGQVDSTIPSRAYVHVVGHAEDPGRFVSTWSNGVVHCQWLDCESPQVTDKINVALAFIRPRGYDIVLLADDDDLQPPYRIEKTVTRITRRCDWVGSRGHTSVELTTGQTTRTMGQSPEAAIVGPAWGFRTSLLAKLGWEWPSCDRGKDRPMLDKIREKAPDAVFGDMTEYMQQIVQLQHGHNLNPRPVPAQGHTWPGRMWQIEGLGKEMWPPWADAHVRALMRLPCWIPHRINAKPTKNAPEELWLAPVPLEGTNRKRRDAL
jgi:hypothetical protein